jgi:putative intracellular protease/amidase
MTLQGRAGSTVKVLMPLPHEGFDPSEAALSWQILAAAGHEIAFATPVGTVSSADPVMLTGIGLDFWSRIPLLRNAKLVGLLLRADHRARAAHDELVENVAFREPLGYAGLRDADFDALLLPGGHAPGMREYLDSTTLQRVVARFFDADKPVAAICHGVVLAARSISVRTGRSVLYGRKTTALTWKLERSGWLLSRYAGRWWDRDYYRTYREEPGEPAGARSVQAEVTRALARTEDFLDVPVAAPDHWRKSCGMFRDTPTDDRPAFIVRDGNYLSARWPGDVHTFAREFVNLLATRKS